MTAQRLGAAPIAVFAALVSTACDPYDVCDPPDPRVIERAPARLSETGIHDADVVSYEPRFALWSDGADKQRWIRLPPGEQVDTTDPDDWRFPAGTRLWKQFSRDGVPIETRLLEKLAPADDAWLMVAYVWNEDGTDATIAPEGVQNARGTTHDVPPAADCRACHDGRRSRVLGYSAIQVDAMLVVPGNDVEQAALGYLHANCSHCHNAARPPAGGSRCYDPRNDLDFRLLASRLGRVEDTPTYATAVGGVVQPGRPDDSGLLTLVARRSASMQMPPLATEFVDETAVALLRQWIEQL